MKRFFSTMLVGAAIAAGGIATASAADLYGRGSMKDTYAPMAMANPATWYIRGQVGYAYHDRPEMSEIAPSAATFDLSDATIGETWTAGIGIGRYFTRNIRGDLTWDHRWEADAHGTAGNTAGIPFAGGTRYFGLKSDVFMANLYYDFDAGRFRPYVGIGLGMTRNSTTTGHVVDPCGCSGIIEGADKWSVAGALMTGFSVQLKDRLHLDAGYRFLYLGEAHTGPITGSTPAGAPVNSGDPRVTDIFAHELRVGLRYDIR